ncbi:MAG: ribonuclease P protein component [Oscillospiraceae bacterium]
MRAAYRELEPQVPTGWDFVFVARTRTTLCRSTELAVALKKCLETLVKTK